MESKITNWQEHLVRKLKVIDIFAITTSLVFGLRIRFPELFDSNLNSFEKNYILFSIVLGIIWYLVLSFNSSRDINILGFGADEYKKLVNATFIVFGSVALFSYIFKLNISRGFVISTFSIGLIILFILRRINRQQLFKQRLRGESISRVLLVCGDAIEPVDERLKTTPHSGLFVTVRFEAREKLNISELINSAKQNSCDVIIIGQTAVLTSQDLRELGWELEKEKISLIVAPAITEIAGPRLKVSNVEGLPLLHLEQPEFSGPKRITKRFLDLLLSLLGLIVLSPFFALIGLSIKLFDNGTVFYKQERIGLNSKIFYVYKFRTMTVNSHENRSTIMSGLDKDLRLAKHPLDPRITKPGHFLRRWSIDELPQLLNVLKGEMSLVGPRPPLAEEVNLYEKFENRRLLVKPGLTGLWQVSGRSELNWEDSVRLDLYYVENWSLTLDILIIMRTAAAVWRGEGAY